LSRKGPVGRDIDDHLHIVAQFRPVVADLRGLSSAVLTIRTTAGLPASTDKALVGCWHAHVPVSDGQQLFEVCANLEEWGEPGVTAGVPSSLAGDFSSPIHIGDVCGIGTRRSPILMYGSNRHPPCWDLAGLDTGSPSHAVLRSTIRRIVVKTGRVPIERRPEVFPRNCQLSTSSVRASSFTAPSL
jgi:hypothetical protein